MDNKVLVILLVAAILVSLVSFVITLSLDESDFVKERTITIIKGAEATGGTVGLVIEPRSSAVNNG
ncbi:MAG TPA: hypothetical protein VJH65_01985 [Candidatus Nanoarchaeia archaeon]|nr:hypothetical protein [Candidatus Nanoarchaeia archaeon]